MKKVIGADEHIALRIEKSQARFKRIKNPAGADGGVGYYFLRIGVTALKGAVHVPLSISSGKKTSGFMYAIEGTATGSLATAEVEAHGEGVISVTLGTLLYCKIPEGQTASFRIQVEMKGKIGKEYTVLIHQISYKLNVTDARYKKFGGGVRTKNLEFR